MHLQLLHGASDEMGHTFSKSLRVACIPKSVKTDSHFATDKSLSRNHFMPEACATTCPGINSLLFFRSSNLCRCSTCTARAMRWDIHYRNPCVLHPKKNVKTDSHFATDMSLSRNHSLAEACATRRHTRVVCFPCRSRSRVTRHYFGTHSCTPA